MLGASAMALHRRSFEICATVGVAARVASTTRSIRTMRASVLHRLECSLHPAKLTTRASVPAPSSSPARVAARTSGDT